MKILKLFKKYFCLTAVSIALLGLVLPGGNSAFRRPDRRRK